MRAQRSFGGCRVRLSAVGDGEKHSLCLREVAGLKVARRQLQAESDLPRAVA